MDQRRQLSVASTTLQMKQQEKRRLELTTSQLAEIPDGTTAYKAIGRMYEHSAPLLLSGDINALRSFLQEPMKDLRGELQKRADETDADTEALEKNVLYLEKSIKETDATIKELMSRATIV